MNAACAFRLVRWTLLIVSIAALALPTRATALLTGASAARNAGFEQRLAATIPGTLMFRDETGREVKLGQYFGESPVILVFAWYGCTTLCPTEIGHVAGTLAKTGLPAGAYRVVVASIDPRDAPADAARIRQRDLRDVVDAEAWHLLTGKEAAIAALAEAAGFRYAYNDDTHQYAHPAGALLLTPDGTIARYYLGVSFTPAALREGVIAAAANEVASPVERLLLVCFHTAPSGRYSDAILATLRIATVALVLAVLALVALKRRRPAGS